MDRNSAIHAGIDTNTLWRLFEGNWKDKELKVYQNLFALSVVPTVYKEFLSMQGARYYRVERKDEFLVLIGAVVIYPKQGLCKDGDSQIIGELKGNGIPNFITDNTRHFEGNGINVLDSKKFRGIFGDAF